MSTVPNIPFPNLNPPPVDPLGKFIANAQNNPNVAAVNFMPGTYLEQDPCVIPDSQFFCLSMWVYIPSLSFQNAGNVAIPLMEFGPSKVPASESQMWIKRFAEAFDATLIDGVVKVDDEPNRVNPDNATTGWVWYQGWYWQFGTVFTLPQPEKSGGLYVKGAGSQAEIYSVIRDIDGGLVSLDSTKASTTTGSTAGSSGGTKAFIPDAWNWVTCSFEHDTRIPYAQSSFAFPGRADNIKYGVQTAYAQVQFWTGINLDFTDPEVRKYFVFTVPDFPGQVSTQPKTIYPAALLQRTKFSGFDTKGNPIEKYVLHWTALAQVQYGSSQIYFDGTANEVDISIGTDEFVENRGTANSVKFIPKSIRLNPDNTPMDPEIIPFAISPSIPG